MKKLISAVIAVTLGATMLVPWTASAALRSIGDDFTSYTTSSGSTCVDTIPDIDSETGVWCSESAENLVAENTQVKWYTSKKFRKAAQAGEVYNYGKKPMVLVDTDKDRLILLDGARAIMKPKADFTLGDKTIIKFDTYTANARSGSIGGSTAGVDLFSDANEENYIKFYHAGHEAGAKPGGVAGACVQLFQNGTRNAGISVNHPETFDQIWSQNLGERNWEITIEGNKLSYSVKRAGAVVFTGSVVDNYNLMKNYTNLLSVSGGGQGKWTAVGNISVTTGEYYNGGMGEPSEVVYRNVIEGNSPAAQIEFDPAVIRRIEAPGYSTMQLSADGTSYTTVTLDGSGHWINTQDATAYKYVKAGGVIDTSSVKVLTDISAESPINMGRGSRMVLYYTLDGAIKTSAGFASSAAEYATVGTDGIVTAVKGGSSNITVGNKTVKIVVKSALELAEDAAQAGDATAIPNYVASQQTLIDQKVNSKITAYQNETDKTSAAAVQARTDVENFFFTDTADSFTDMDVVTTTKLLSMTAREKGVFVDKILEQPALYNLGTNIEGVRGFETEVIAVADAACEKAQLDIIALLNTNIAGNNTTDVNDFFFTTGVDSLSDIDAITTDVAAELTTPEEQGRFVEKIKTYTFASAQAADIAKLEDTIKKEIAVTAIDNKATATDVKTALEAENAQLGFPLTSGYFTSTVGNVNTNILTNLSNTQFVNYADLETRFYESLVMENLKTSMNNTYISGLLEEFQLQIGYNTVHYDTVKATVAQALIDNKATLTDVTAVKNYIDTYTAPIINQGGQVVGGINPGNNGNVYASGNGGSGVGKGSAIVPAVTETADKNAAVSKTQVFADIPVDAWYYEATRFLKASGAAAGYENGEYLPNNSIIRAEFMSMLMKAFGIEMPEDAENADEIIFNDISRDDWYFECMNNGGKLGIISGFAGMSNPKALISRQEMAAFIMRVVEYKGINLPQVKELTPYADENNIADWAVSPIYKLSTAGVISGNNGSVLPADNATRAEAAQMIYMACEAAKTPVPTAE